MEKAAFSYNNIINIILDDLSLKTGLDSILINDNDSFDDYTLITRKTSSSIICRLATNDFNCLRKCYENHKELAFKDFSTITFGFCHLGLFNVSIPINLKFEKVALLYGQFIHKDFIEKSCKIFQNFLDTLDISKYEQVKYRNIFSEIKTVTQIELNKYLSNNVDSTVKIIQHFLNENTKNRLRMTATAHELLLPMSSMVINAENLRDETYDKNPDLDLLREYSGNILSEVTTLNLHIHNLRRVLRNPIAKQQFEFTKKPIYPLLNQEKNKFALDAEKKKFLWILSQIMINIILTYL
jgi:hypothetical protein